ncbi:MAG: hypothetical protein QXR17_04655 [Candidatus Bathyarchaeia archaeon]
MFGSLRLMLAVANSAIAPEMKTWYMSRRHIRDANISVDFQVKRVPRKYTAIIAEVTAKIFSKMTSHIIVPLKRR